MPDELPYDLSLQRHNAMRVIALETLFIALLARAPVEHLFREMAAYISARPGLTHHPMTVRAADEMLSLLERSSQFRSPLPEKGKP